MSYFTTALYLWSISCGSYLYLWVTLVPVFVGHTYHYALLCTFISVHTGLCICSGGSYLCLLERFVSSRFSSGAQLLRIHVVERDNVSADVVSERILFVGILKWSRYLQMCFHCGQVLEGFHVVLLENLCCCLYL